MSDVTNGMKIAMLSLGVISNIFKLYLRARIHLYIKESHLVYAHSQRRKHAMNGNQIYGFFSAQLTKSIHPDKCQRSCRIMLTEYRKNSASVAGLGSTNVRQTFDFAKKKKLF